MKFNITSYLAVAATLSRTVAAKAVFAHYMLGAITEEHAQKDIDDAMAVGFDGFALNIGDSTQPWIYGTMKALFSHAQSRGFKLFVSMDVSAAGASCAGGGKSCNGPFDYQWIWDSWKGDSAYYKVNGKALITTFSSGGFGSDTWLRWKSGLANDMFFVPDFDDTAGYYEAAQGWWDYWGGVVDGISSWESAWPQPGAQGSNAPGDVSIDVTALKGAHDRGKQYMIGLSPLQYKNAYGANVYRRGDLNLPKRMENILNMNPQPDFVQVITWNDGPESHYIGNLWTEQNGDSQPQRYANEQYWSHKAWQPLVSSFIDAYKNGKGPSGMVPKDGSLAVGAAWYRVVDPAKAVCPNDNKPNGFTDGLNALYFSMVQNPSAARGYTVVIDAGGQVKTSQANPGLNIISSDPAVLTGAQKIQLKDASGNVVMSATGGMCVSDGCPTQIYASNYQVIPLIKGDNPKACTPWP